MTECNAIMRATRHPAVPPSPISTPTGTIVSFRRLRHASDYVGMASVRAGSVDRDQVDPQSPREKRPTAEDLAETFPFSDEGEQPDLLLAEADECIIGYAHVRWRWTEITGARVYLHLGHVLPEWRGQGVGSALLEWSRARIRDIAAGDAAAGPTFFASNASSSEVEAVGLLRSHDYRVVRTLTDMVLDLQEPMLRTHLPAGVELRPVEPTHHRAIYAAYKDAMSASFLTTQTSEDDFRVFVADNFEGDGFDPRLCHIAWAGNEVVGYVLGRTQRGIGLVAEVGVRRAWQRQRIGTALMTSALEAFRLAGVARARLFTDADDGLGARTLYERLGFREAKQHLLFRQEFDR